MREKAELLCPKCGSDAIQCEHPNGATGRAIWYCLCCRDDDYNYSRHFTPLKFPIHIHGPSCKDYEGWKQEMIKLKEQVRRNE